jgi:hypothetical protein
MEIMKKPLIWMSGLVILAAAAVFFYFWGRPAPVEMREELYPCVVYYRKVLSSPRRLIAHIVTVDLSCKNIEPFVTPPEKGEKDQPLRGRTTLQFANEFGVQVAVNGDGFSPWWSKTLWDYYPRQGDAVTPNGFAASKGKEYGPRDSDEITLYINERGEASFGTPIRKVYNAISGSHWLVRGREVIENLADTGPAPRTAVGLDGPGTRLIIIVVDGRQPLYSEGATIAETAELMLFYGGDNAILLDGGGSSTLVIDWPGEGLKVMNSPIDLYIPGRERVVGNHLGVKTR